MLRKTFMVGRDSEGLLEVDRELIHSPLALDAVRSIIDITAWLLNKYPWPTSVAALFGAFKIHIPYAILANAILNASDRRIYASDMERMREIGTIVTKVATEEKAYVPLMQAMQFLQTEIMNNN
jgi:hypothetical protein